MTVVLMAVAAATAAGVQSATGLGFALVLTPVLVALLSPAAAVISVTLLGLELNLLVLTAERRPLAIAWPELRPILIAAIPGAAAGVLVLQALSRPLLQSLVGALILGVVGLRVGRARREAGATGETGGRPPGSWPGLAIGITTGVLTTSSGVSGPPLALWLTHRGLGPVQLRDSLSAAFLALGGIGVVALAPLVAHTRLAAEDLGLGLVCVALGHAAGSRLFRRMAPRHFEPLLLTVVGLAGAASLAAGASHL